MELTSLGIATGQALASERVVSFISWALRKRENTLDPLEQVNMHITRARGASKWKPDAGLRSRLAEIERNVNDDIKVKTVMVDIEEVATVSAKATINVELARGLIGNSQLNTRHTRYSPFR